MVQMIERRRLADIGEAEAYEVSLDDGETVRIIVSNALRKTMGSDEAFTQQLARTLHGRNSSVPTRSSRSFV